jgi:LysM repeat protein
MNLRHILVITVWLAFLAPLYSQESGKASPVASDLFGLETLSKQSHYSKVFRASIYAPAELTSAEAKHKLVLDSLQKKGSTDSPEQLATETQKLFRVALERALPLHLKDLQKEAEEAMKDADISFAESLASPHFLKAKSLDAETQVLFREYDQTFSGYQKLSSPNRDNVWTGVLEIAEKLTQKWNDQKSTAEKAKSLSLSQVEHLVVASLDLDNDLAKVREIGDSTQRAKADSFRAQVSEHLKLIQAGNVKEGYQKIEVLRVEATGLFAETLGPKTKQNLSELKETIAKLNASFNEIQVNLEDEDFSASYQQTKDTLAAAGEALQFAFELESQERYGEALGQSEEANRMVYLVSEDLPSLQRKQSHVLKKQATANNTEPSPPSNKNPILIEDDVEDDDDEEVVAPKEKKPLISIYPQGTKTTNTELGEEMEVTPTVTKPITSKTNQVHITKSRDTLSSISQKYYGKARFWKRIHKANKHIKNPDRIFPKQRIKIP